VNVIPIIADSWKMDGGVAFGVVPRSLWSKVYPVDDSNLIRIVTRCLLILTGTRKILVDTGMGNKRGDKYYGFRFREKIAGLQKEINKLGISCDDITDILFTHLHDDHVGGATFYDTASEVHKTFSRADYWCSADQWIWSKTSNKRESAAFFNDNSEVLENSGRLKLIYNEGEWLDGISIRIFNGHTRGQIVPIVTIGDDTYVFTADFIPAKANIPIPYVPAVDIEPLLSMNEKEVFLKVAALNNYTLIFQHDFYNEACRVIETEKGVVAGESFSINQSIKSES